MRETHHQTNVEFVTEIMEFSKYGALVQIFVLQAIEKFANEVANAPPEIFAKTDHFISTKAWQGVAREIVQKIDQRNSH